MRVGGLPKVEKCMAKGEDPFDFVGIEQPTDSRARWRRSGLLILAVLLALAASVTLILELQGALF